MPKFKVTAVYYTYCTAEVETENAEQAYKLAKDMDGGEFKPSNENFDWHINEITEIK